MSIGLCENTWPAAPTNHARDNSRQLLGMADAPLGEKTTFNDFPRGVSDGKTHLNTSETLSRLQREKHFIQRHTRNQPNHPSYSSVTLFGYHHNRRRLKNGSSEPSPILASEPAQVDAWSPNFIYFVVDTNIMISELNLVERIC